MIKVFLKARYFENLKHIDDDSIRENLYSLRTILNKFSHGVRSSFINLFTDSLDEYDAVIEKDILDEVYKSSKYSKQDVVLLSSKIVKFLQNYSILHCLYVHNLIFQKNLCFVLANVVDKDQYNQFLIF